MRLLLAGALVLPAACGGGGSDGSPVQWSPQTVSGTAVLEGTPSAGARVILFCSDGNGGMRQYAATTDANGAWSERVDTAVAPCLLRATSAPSATGSQISLHSHVKAFNNGTATANITPLTDAIVAITVTNPFPPLSQESLNTLATQTAQGSDTAAWTTLRTKLSSGTYINVSTDLNAMTDDPVTGAIQVTTDTASPPGQYGLLQKLAAAGFGSNQLQAIAQGQLYAEVPGSGGAEVQDLRSRLVWQRCVVGMVWTGTQCTGTPGLLLWSELKPAAAATPQSTAPGATPWYVPGFGELRGLLVMPTGGNSRLDPTWFPADPGEATWVDMPLGRPNVSGAINTKTGRLVPGRATDAYFLRLVRQTR